MCSPQASWGHARHRQIQPSFPKTQQGALSIPVLLDPLMIYFDPNLAALGRLSPTDPHSPEQPKVPPALPCISVCWRQAVESPCAVPVMVTKQAEIHPCGLEQTLIIHRKFGDGECKPTHSC